VPLAGGGRLFFLLDADWERAPARSGSEADNRIIAEARTAQSQRPDQSVIVVSKDVNLRVKCAAVGIPVEDYRNDSQVDDISTMSGGLVIAGTAFWDEQGDDIESWRE